MKPQTPISKVLKSEIRISKFETNPNDKNPKLETDVLNFEHLNFEFVSDFVLRASNLFRIQSLVIGILRKNDLPPKTYHLKPSGGYALMLSIVVSSIVLSIGLSLFNIVQKELILSATGRDSQFAFYSADGGVECALYWDIKKLEFPSSEADWNNGNPPSNSTDDCGMTDFSIQTESRWNEIDDLPIGVISNLNTNGTAYGCGDTCASENPIYTGHENDIVTLTFQVEFQEEGDTSPGSCAKVVVSKTGNGQTGIDYSVITRIDSRGYNDECQADGSFNNPALVERAISVTY